MIKTKAIKKKCAKWLDCTACGLHQHRRHVVLGEGDLPCEILFIGEAPGRTEDLIGRPFIGASGSILRGAIAEATIEAGREDDPPKWFVTNTVACIPRDEPRGPFREPTKDEIISCMPRLKDVVAHAFPYRVVLLGAVARRSMARLYPEATALVHPAYIARKGLQCTEYRGFVRGLAEVFRPAAQRDAIEDTMSGPA